MSKLKILLSGMIAGIPRQGGASWAVLQYLLGLHQLGHEVHLLEPMRSKAVRKACLVPGVLRRAKFLKRESSRQLIRQSLG